MEVAVSSLALTGQLEAEKKRLRFWNFRGKKKDSESRSKVEEAAALTA